MDKNLTDEYLKFCDNLKDDSKTTWDDFFDFAEVPENERSDFLIGCILKQAKEKEAKEKEDEKTDELQTPVH